MDRRHLVARTILLLALAVVPRPGGARAEGPPPLEAPDEGPAGQPERLADATAAADTRHELFLPPAAGRERVYVEKAPPEPIRERPGASASAAGAVWVDGYWEWDAGRNSYVWVTGTWHVPAPGEFWVNGYWRRAERGWFRVPGFWSTRQAPPTDWRRDGPPAQRPEDVPGPSPNPDSFYVAGQFVPDGRGVAWKPGFWTPARTGWEWVPARWVHQSGGWAFKPGFWSRVEGDVGPPPRATSIASTASGPADSRVEPASGRPTPEGSGLTLTASRASDEAATAGRPAVGDERETSSAPLSVEALPRPGSGTGPDGEPRHLTLSPPFATPPPTARDADRDGNATPVVDPLAPILGTSSAGRDALGTPASPVARVPSSQPVRWIVPQAVTAPPTSRPPARPNARAYPGPGRGGPVRSMLNGVFRRGRR